MNDKFVIKPPTSGDITFIIPWVWSPNITLGLWPLVISQFPHHRDDKCDITFMVGR